MNWTIKEHAEPLLMKHVREASAEVRKNIADRCMELAAHHEASAESPLDAHYENDIANAYSYRAIAMELRKAVPR